LSGRTLAVGVGGVVLVIAVLSGYALLTDDGGKSPRPTYQTPVPVPPKKIDVKPVDPAAKPPAPTAPGLKPTTAGKTATTVTTPPPQPVAPARAATAPLGRVIAGKGGGPVVVVRGADGSPLAGATVDVRTDKRHLVPRPTGRDGEAALDPVSADEGKLQGTVRHPAYANPQTFTADATATRIEVRMPASPSGFLAGTIHTANGLPPPRADINLVLDGQEILLPSESFATWESGSGRYRVALAPGSYTVWATAPGFVKSDNAYPVLGVAQDTNIDLILEQPASIAGTVMMPPEVQNARPPIVLTFDIECVRGTIDNPNTAVKHVPLEVDVNGAFLLEDLQAGQCRVRATDANHVGPWFPAKLGEGTHLEGIHLSLTGATTPSVRGIVRDSSGAVVAGATVTSKLSSTTTDAGGGFELRGLDPGVRQKILVEKDGYGPAEYPIEPPFAGGPPLPDIVVTLQLRGSATGRVTRKGISAAGVKVLLIQKVEGGGVKTYGPAVTDGSGTWTLTGLDLGVYYLKTGDNPDPWDEQGAPSFVIAPGDQKDVGSVETP
jgi:hypothetical protein